MAREAGTSALAMYRAARRRRRLRGVGATLLAALGILTAAAGLPAPVVVACGAAALLMLMAAVAGPSSRHAGRWMRGAEGERRTAQVLSCLPARRWTVWHDLRVPASRANIDHVVVGRTGIWVVDTKSTRSEVRARWRSVHFGDRRLDTAAVRWEADVLARALAARTRDLLPGPLPVRPVVAVHGRGLRARGGRSGGVPVVPAEMLPERIRRGRRRLGRRDRRLVADAVRTCFGPAASGESAGRRPGPSRVGRETRRGRTPGAGAG